ncbi:hypothetical protein JZ751_024243, partial [Albula glossodonta]
MRDRPTGNADLEDKGDKQWRMSHKLVAPQWCCGSSSAADPETGVSAAGGGGGGGPPTPPQGPKTGRVKRMARLVAELLLLLGLLLLTLHITVLRSSPLPQGNATLDHGQNPLLAE